MRGKLDLEGRLRFCFGVTVVLVLAAVVALSVAGRPLAGLALALGLVLGSANTFLAARSVSSGLPFAALSVGRLLLFSVLGLGLGVLLGGSVAWLVLIGLAASQLVLAVVTAVEVARA